jgi:putative transposase
MVGRTPPVRGRPLVGSFFVRIPHLLAHYSCVAFYRRRLPHLDEAERPVFLTWRLDGSLPPHRPFPATLSSGQAFAVMDRLLDQTRSGPFYLRRPELAEMVVKAIQYSATVLGHCTLHAYVVMPNHVHLLVSPAVALCKLTKSLKGITAKRANAMLALTGSPFWQDESYDHLVRQAGELDKIRYYIEENPVRAGLVMAASQYRWSSAGWATGGSPADQGVRPTIRPQP